MVTFIENILNGKLCLMIFDDWYLKRIHLQTLLCHELIIFLMAGVIRSQQGLCLAYHLFDGIFAS